MASFAAIVPPLTMLSLLAILDGPPASGGSLLVAVGFSYLLGLGPAAFAGYFHWWLGERVVGRLARLAAAPVVHALAPLPFFIMLALLMAFFSKSGDGLLPLAVWLGSTPLFAVTGLAGALFCEFVWPGAGPRSLAESGRLPT